jgi:hypothetical protein
MPVVIKRLAECGLKHIGFMLRPEGHVQKFVLLLTGGKNYGMYDMYISSVSN